MAEGIPQAESGRGIEEEDAQGPGAKERDGDQAGEFEASAGEGSEHARASANIKTELQIAFPSVNFSVKSNSFSMGDSVNVSWTDGPTQKQVEEITGKYQRGSFNGMIDMYESDNSPYSDAVSTWLGQSKYVSESRSFSPEAKAAIEGNMRDCGERTDNTVYQIAHESEIFSTEFERFDTDDNNRTIAVFAKPEVAAFVPTETTTSAEGITVSENDIKGGVEIKFAGKPDEDTRSTLKRNGFRWSRFQKLWYAKANDRTRAFANSLTNGLTA